MNPSISPLDIKSLLLNLSTGEMPPLLSLPPYKIKEILVLALHFLQLEISPDNGQKPEIPWLILVLNKFWNVLARWTLRTDTDVVEFLAAGLIW